MERKRDNTVYKTNILWHHLSEEKKWGGNYKVDISLDVDQVVGVALYLTCFYSGGSYNHLKKLGFLILSIFKSIQSITWQLMSMETGYALVT